MADFSLSKKKHLVLLHGWGLNQGVWYGVRRQLAQTYNVLTPDLPGFGLCRDYPSDYQLDQVVEQLARQLPEQSFVCGWSLGGLLAIALAERYPDKVQKLGLIAASPCFMTKADWPGMRAEVMAQFARALSENLEQTIQRFLAIQALGAEHARQDIAQLRMSLSGYPLPQPQAVAMALQLLIKTDLRQTFARLQIPIVGCFGRLDSLVPAAVVPLIKQLQPYASFDILSKASHAPFISHPVEFVAWLTRVFD